MSAEHFSGIRHRRGGVVVIGVVTAVTTALQAPTAAAQSPEAPLDLTCTVTSPGLPAALAVPDVPATLERRPDPREGDATDMGPAPTDPVDSRGELTLRLPAGLGDLLAAHLPGARPSPEGLRINVDIAAEGEATGGEAGGRAAVGDTREVRLAMPGDSAVEPTPALATLAADFTCRVIEEVAPVTPAGPAGFAGPAAPGEPLAELRSEPSSGQLNPAAYQAGGADSVTSLSSGSGAATPHAPGGQAPTGQQQTVVTPGEASRATTQVSGAGTTTSRSATSTSNSGGTGAGGASTTRSTAADRSATSTSTTSRSTAAAPAIPAAAAATSTTGTSAAAAGSVQQASGSAAGGAAYTVAGAQLLASNSSSSLSSEGDSEFGFHVSLSALLWATGGIIVLSLLYALWTSIRLRRLKAMTADQQLEG